MSAGVLTESALSVLLGTALGLGLCLLISLLPRVSAPSLERRLAPYIRDITVSMPQRTYQKLYVRGPQQQQQRQQIQQQQQQQQQHDLPTLTPKTLTEIAPNDPLSLDLRYTKLILSLSDVLSNFALSWLSA